MIVTFQSLPSPTDIVQLPPPPLVGANKRLSVPVVIMFQPSVDIRAVRFGVPTMFMFVTSRLSIVVVHWKSTVVVLSYVVVLPFV